MSSPLHAVLDIKHTGLQRGMGRHGPRLRVITGTGRPLLVEKITDPALFDIIEKRAWRLMALPHDNLVKVFSLRRSEDGTYLEIYTEMTSELPVRDILGKMGKLDAFVVRNYARQLLNGLKCLHDYGLYMGGLKHEDILLAGRGKVKISNAHTAIAGDGHRVDENAVKDDPQRVAARRRDLSSLGSIISDLLKCVINTPPPPMPAGPGPMSMSAGFSARSPAFEPRAFFKLCNASSSAGELLAHSFCGPLPNWREQRRRMSPTASNGPIQPPRTARHTSRGGPQQFQPPTPRGRPSPRALASSRRPLPSGRLPSGRLPSGRLPSGRRVPPDSFRGSRTPRAQFPPTPRGQKKRPTQLQGQQRGELGGGGGGGGGAVSRRLPQAKQTESTQAETLDAPQPKDAVSAATAKHRAAIGLDPLTKRTPAQKHFLSILSSSHSSSASGAASSKPTESDSTGGAVNYRRKKASGLAIMHERRRVNELISNVEKLNQDLANGPTIPKLRLSALAPKPILRSYNLIGDAQISSSDEDLSDEDVVAYDEADELAYHDND
jgi:serine/threonine protein kinase